MTVSKVALIAVVVLVFIATASLASASVLTYKPGTTPFNSEIQTAIRITKIGSVPIASGMLEISGRKIFVSGAITEMQQLTGLQQEEPGDSTKLLLGELIKTKLSSDKSGIHIKGLAYFTEGKLLENRTVARQRDIVFIKDGFVAGKIASVTAREITIDDRGTRRVIAVSAVTGIRSPRAYVAQLDLSPLNTKDSNPNAQYDASNCTLSETVPPFVISSQSIAPKANVIDPDIEDLADDALLDSSLSIPANLAYPALPNFPGANRNRPPDSLGEPAYGLGQ